MASIQKRGKTFQYTVSRIVNGKPAPIRKGGFRTKSEAKIAAAEVEAQLAKGLNPVMKKIPFAEYLKDWIDLYKAPKISSTTLKRYEYTLSAVTEYFLGYTHSKYQKA